MTDDPNNYSVKELLAQFVIPALDDLRTSADSRDQKYMQIFEKQEARFDKLEAWRNKGIGAIAILTGVMIPIAIPVIITVLSASISGALFYWLFL